MRRVDGSVCVAADCAAGATVMGSGAGVWVGDLVERVGNGGVVGGGGGEGLLCEAPAGFAGDGAVVACEFLDESGIIGNARNDGDVFKVLGGGADHGGTADVDVLNEMAEGDAGLRGGFLKGVEIHNHHVDGLDL